MQASSIQVGQKRGCQNRVSDFTDCMGRRAYTSGGSAQAESLCLPIANWMSIMKIRYLPSALATACAVTALGAAAQISLPPIVQLPNQDFVFTWGRVDADERERAHFHIDGREQQFFCRLSGAFRPSSRERDFYNLRAFEQSLIGTPYFIQEATYAMNDYDRSNDLDWAVLECTVPNVTEDEAKAQERVDRALERAERDRERRRAREEN